MQRDVQLAPRSLLVMKGESRYLWTHKIPKRKIDKVPVVLGVFYLLID